MKIKLPKDIKKYVVFHIIKQALCCLVPLITVIVLMMIFGERIFAGQGQSMVTAYILVIPLTLYLTKFPKRFIDSTWIGEITDVKVISTEQRKGKGDWGLPSYYHKNTLVIIVKTDNGKEIKRVVYEGEANQELLEKYLKAYHIGAEVLHIYGTKYVRVLKENNCIICGNDNSQDAEICVECGHALHIVE